MSLIKIREDKLIFRYPEIDEWYENFVRYNQSRGGVLPLAVLSPQFIRIMNTIGSGLLMIAMGLATNVAILVKTLKAPALPLVGVLAQFIAMPLTGIFLISVLKMEPLEALATYLFALSPGGGTSNLMCYYMDLNLELSITLTFICTLCAFGFMPAYLQLLPYLINDYNPNLFEIPYVELVKNLALIAGCLCLGFIFNWWRPKESAKAARILSPITYAILAIMAMYG